MKTIIVVLMAVAFHTSIFSQTKWTVDNAHSKIGFTVTHLLIAEVEGVFRTFSGTMTTKNADFTDAEISFTAEAKSIDTDNETRDNHLRSSDFLNVEQYPQLAFQSSSFKKESGNKYTLKGNLTIRGITRPVTFNVTYGGTVKDNMGNLKAGFKATTTINRFDYGVKWNNLTEAGGAVAGQDVTINLNLEFGKMK